MIFLVLFTHFVADFICQTDNMAKNKSKSLKWLSFHIAVYTLIFCYLGIEFALINGVCHFLIDFITSKISSYYYAKGRIHDFFVVIGFDQLLHTSILIMTLSLVFPIWKWV